MSVMLALCEVGVSTSFGLELRLVDIALQDIVMNIADMYYRI